MAEKCGQKRGSIAFFATYRPPVPFDIYSKAVSDGSVSDEVLLTDGGKFYNYNGQFIPASALKTILKRLRAANLAYEGTEDDVDSGDLWGIVFVSERTDSLETLHIGLIQDEDPEFQVFNFAQVYDTFKGVRMEDSGCIAGDYLIYVSTKEPASEPHQPWNAVYRTNLHTGETQRLTPPGIADFSPSVSPDGKRIAVATLENKKGGWCGEIEDLRTNICIIDVEQPLNRDVVVLDGGWPTWGSDNVLFFHRNIEKVEIVKKWGVFRVDLSEGKIVRVTPKGISAMTPAAIHEDEVVVATMRKNFTFDQDERDEEQYRHIEVFSLDEGEPITDESAQITRTTRPKADHFNPFVVRDEDGDVRICYHRCNTEKVRAYDVVQKEINKLQSPDPTIDIFRVPGVFPSISKCGTKLAFVDNEFKSVWVADSKGLYMVYQANVANKLFSPVWNTVKDTLYVCEGPPFSKNAVVIVAIIGVTKENRTFKWLTDEDYNSAFPSNNPDGTRLVYRSTKNGHKNLYIMEDAELGEYDRGKITRLTEGEWTDTHCHWSPNGDWIAFSTNRDNPTAKTPKDLPDPGYFAVYLVKADNKDVVVKVMDSGKDYLGKQFPGHVNHPFFSPDGKSLVVAADLAAVSCEPISMPLFVHSVRPYGDIFLIDIDPNDIYKNKNLKKYTRLTHSKFENSTATWTKATAKDLNKAWNVKQTVNICPTKYEPACPYRPAEDAESIHMTGHLCIPKRCC